MTALGGWLAALPILAVLALLFGDWFKDGGLLICGLLAIAASIIVLRQQTLPLFVEQLAIPVLLAGSAAIGFYIGDKNSDTAVCIWLALLAIVVAMLVPRNWLRALLGATACGLAFGALLLDSSEGRWTTIILSLYLATLVFVASQYAKRAIPLDRRGLDAAHAIDALSMGWGAVTLAALALFNGSTFLMGAIVPGVEGGITPPGGDAGKIWHFISAFTAAGAAAHLVATWPSLRQTWAAVVALVAIGLSLVMPTLGPVLLVLAMCATAGRWTMAAAAGATAAWIIGAFYYQVSLPFVTKALIMIVAGIALGASAWFSLRGPAALEAMQGNAAQRLRGAMGIALTALAVFVVANFAIWQKEDIIAKGKPVFVELIPVDPRSLMQGDFMALQFALPEDIRFGRDGKSMAVGSIDARGILTITRPDNGTPLAAGETLIQLIPNDGSATIVTNAWYFKEGEAERFAGARYGEFRVMKNGRALLVGMRGPNLEKL